MAHEYISEATIILVWCKKKWGMYSIGSALQLARVLWLCNIQRRQSILVTLCTKMEAQHFGTKATGLHWKKNMPES